MHCLLGAAVRFLRPWHLLCPSCHTMVCVAEKHKRRRGCQTSPAGACAGQCKSLPRRLQKGCQTACRRQTTAAAGHLHVDGARQPRVRVRCRRRRGAVCPCPEAPPGRGGGLCIGEDDTEVQANAVAAHCAGRDGAPPALQCPGGKHCGGRRPRVGDARRPRVGGVSGGPWRGAGAAQGSGGGGPHAHECGGGGGGRGDGGAA
mmetsp:Transcript_8628/g.35953  ORF Transcript_8628/g.35953 Transcript_8628/m.35953 type:complete len:203 (+) Transcript_8628:273-881(+)